MLTLYTFAISHFSEKARWALDFEGIPYVERRLLPGPHLLVTRRLAQKSTVPVIDHDGTVVQGSSAILDYLEQRLGARRLTPSTEAATASAELEKLSDHAFGLGVQRIAYDALLSDRRTVTDLWSYGGPRWSRAFYGFAYSGVASAVRRMYKITPNAVARAKDRFRTAMDATDRALQGTRYLTGDAPGRADVTLAALLAPLCRPPEHFVPWPDLPPALRALEDELRERPTWKHVLTMYRLHRGPQQTSTARKIGT